jgi:hypothetical protein
LSPTLIRWASVVIGLLRPFLCELCGSVVRSEIILGVCFSARYYLLYQAQENICPLNNLRLLASGPNQVEQCPRNQLATPDVCCRCLAERGRRSGALHRAERELAGVGTQDYYARLRQ